MPPTTRLPATKAREFAFLCICATALRLACFLGVPALAETLANRVEISTPVTGFKRLKEGVFLFNNGLSPYDGGVFHQPPLLLALFSLVPDSSHLFQPSVVLYIAADILGAVALMRIVKTGKASVSRLYTSQRKDAKWDELAVAATFLLNPLSVASSLGRSTSVFSNCAILHAIAAATTGDLFGTVYFFSLASYLSMSLALLAPPLALLAFDSSFKSPTSGPSALRFFATFTGGVVVTLASLLGLSWFLMDFSWTFIKSTYGFEMLLVDLTPNIGLWWYFFTEMFDSFRAFFLGVFWLHMTSYMPALTIRLRKQPLFATVSVLGVLAIFKPYPSIADVSLYFSLLPLYRHIFPLLRYGFIAAAALLYAALLGPAFWHLWIYAGSGNANFFYAITLVWSLGLSIVLADSVFAVLRDELDAERPELRGKDVRQI